MQKTITIKWCEACSEKIDYTVDEKVEQGWIEWEIEPIENVFVCSLECEDIILQYNNKYQKNGRNKNRNVYR